MTNDNPIAEVHTGQLRWLVPDEEQPANAKLYVAPQPVKQEPVAWLWRMHGWAVTAHGKHRAVKSYVDVCKPPMETQASDDFIDLTPLYTRPVRTKDLTGDELSDLMFDYEPCENPFKFARAVIAADREKNK